MRGAHAYKPDMCYVCKKTFLRRGDWCEHLIEAAEQIEAAEYVEDDDEVR